MGRYVYPHQGNIRRGVPGTLLYILGGGVIRGYYPLIPIRGEGWWRVEQINYIFTADWYHLVLVTRRHHVIFHNYYKIKYFLV